MESVVLRHAPLKLLAGTVTLLVPLAAGCAIRRAVPATAAGTPSAAAGTRASSAAAAPAATAAAAPASTAPAAAPSPEAATMPGWLLIADDENDRLLLVTPEKKIVWEFPRPGDLQPGQSFKGPDDAFFTPDMKQIVVNEEENSVVAAIDIATHRIVWQYGHPGKAGGAPGYLSNPDDAYPLPDGRISVADIKNCRIIFLDRGKGLVGQYGKTGNCTHNPPQTFSSPNGDTPLPDGGMLVTEIGGANVDRLDSQGRLIWDLDLHRQLRYASDAQLMTDGNILTSDYSKPGRVLVATPQGQTVWEFGAQSGPDMLNHPSMAIELPNGNVALNDDYRDRVIILDAQTHKIVWQYGVTDKPGTQPGYLNEPDGVEFAPLDKTGLIPISR